MRKIKGYVWSGWLCWVCGCGWLDSMSSASAGGREADPTFCGEDADPMLLGEAMDSSPPR